MYIQGEVGGVWSVGKTHSELFKTFQVGSIKQGFRNLKFKIKYSKGY